jgi:hypothetical protein
VARRRTHPKPVCTLDERTALVEVQGGACAICGEVTELHLDHSYRTGKTRGLLCRTCNTGCGQFGDSVKRLQAAIRYLRHPPYQQMKETK